MTVSDIREHFLSVASWVDSNNTSDVIYAGDSDRSVSRVGVGWSCSAENLQAAAADLCDLYVCHEALLHGSTWAPGMDSADTLWGRRRLDVLETSGMACLRLHDTWDNFPQFGIRESWRRFLGLGELLAERSYHYPGKNRFAPASSLALSATTHETLGSFARDLAIRCAQFPTFAGATLYGDPGSPIRTVATGVGCHIPTMEMLDLGADALVVTFDRAFELKIRIPLTEMGANIIAVEHSVSELPGMKQLATYLERTFPDLKTSFYCREPQTQFVTGTNGGRAKTAETAMEEE